MLCLGFVLLLYFIELAYPPWTNAERLKESISDGSVITITGRLAKIEHKNYSTNLYLKKISFDPPYHSNKIPDTAVPYGLVASLSDEKDEKNLHIGSRVKLSGEFSCFDKAWNLGNFDAFNYYAIRRFDGRLKKSRVISVSEDYSRIEDMLYRFKERTKEVFGSYLDEREAGTLCALILGDKTELDTEVREDYANAGISHILSLSGLHIAAVGLLLVSILRRSGLNVWLSGLISGSAMLLYSLMTGFSTSTIRAFIMFVMGTASQSIKRTYDLLSSAAVSAILILVENPCYLHDSGFLLSFSAVMGISLIYPVLKKISDHYIDRSALRSLHNSNNKTMVFLDKILSSMLFSISIELATLPVAESCFYQIPRYGFIINLVVIPLMTGVLSSGIILAAAGNLALLSEGFISLHTLFDSFSVISSKITYAILRFYDVLTDIFNGFKSNLYICGKPSRVQNVFYVFLMILSVLCFAVSEGGYRNRKSGKNKKEGMLVRFLHFRNMVYIIIPFMIASAVFILSFRKPAPVEFHAICVGQGDSTLIYGSDVPVILIDGGASDIKNTGKYRMIPCLKAHGIDNIDYIFISHFDSDHVNGIIELLKDKNSGISIGEIIIPSVVPLIEENENCKILLEESGKESGGTGIPVKLMNAGDMLHDGGIVISCLAPDVKGDDRWKNMDINDNSLVLHIMYEKTGFSALFTGDMSKTTEEGILNDLREGRKKAYALKREVNLLKTAHHGSRTASMPEFIELISPEISTISCGKDNGYGHPHKETLETLNSIKGNHVFLTTECGEITIKVFEDRVTVSSFLK